MDRTAGRGVLVAEPARNGPAPVAALGQIAVVSQHAGHQLGEQTRHPARSHRPCRPAREAESRQGRGDHVEGIALAAAVAFGMGERIDDLDELRDRAGPAVGDEQRQGRRTAARFVDEVDVDAIDGRREVREPVEHLLLRPPVELLQPVGAQLLHVVEVGAVGPAAVIRHLVPDIAGHPGADALENFVCYFDAEGLG